jgi:pyruvate kinase
MAEIAEFTEHSIDYKEWFRTTDFRIRSNADAVSHSTCAMAIDVGAKCIIVNSRTGQTARMVSRFRCPVDIIGLTTNEQAWRKLNMSWGVLPVMSEKFESNDVMFYNAMKQAKQVLRLAPGDNVVMTGGQIGGPRGNTNIIRLEVIK